ncbi:MAG: hypothetical protein ACK56K_10395, partial [Akkermansiaceae bacterium]
PAALGWSSFRDLGDGACDRCIIKGGVQNSTSKKFGFLRTDFWQTVYTANWKWDMVMYLWYFKADLHRGQSIIGSVEYQASGVDMNKFGNVDDKVGPMLKKLIVGE